MNGLSLGNHGGLTIVDELTVADNIYRERGELEQKKNVTPDDSGITRQMMERERDAREPFRPLALQIYSIFLLA